MESLAAAVRHTVPALPAASEGERERETERERKRERGREREMERGSTKKSGWDGSFIGRHLLCVFEVARECGVALLHVLPLRLF